jgi:hypothetical protein
MTFSNKSDYDPRLLDSVVDRRAAAQREEKERAALRQKYLSAQTAQHREPQQRIRLWEQLHCMHLPTAAGHRLVRVIAEQTALTIEQIQAEQVRRAAAEAPLAEPTP